MGKRIGNRINAAFEEAEKRRSCLVASSSADERWLQRAVGRGEVVRPCRGVYARESYWSALDPRQKALHMMRALSCHHPDWVFAGASAALAHGLEVGYAESDRLCLATTPKANARSSLRFRRIIVSDDVCVERQGVRVTSFARTVYDCLRTMSFPSALAVADSALRSKGIGRKRLARNVSASCGNRSDMRRVLDVVALADGRAENGGESKVRAKIITYGYAIPDLQYEVPDPMNPSTCYRVDFAWESADGSLVFGELDGKDKYVDVRMTNGRATEEVLFEERRREARITVGNRPVRVMRFSFAEACDEAYFRRLLDSYGVPHA